MARRKPRRKVYRKGMSWTDEKGTHKLGDCYGVGNRTFFNHYLNGNIIGTIDLPDVIRIDIDEKVIL